MKYPAPWAAGLSRVGSAGLGWTAGGGAKLEGLGPTSGPTEKVGVAAWL